MFYALIYSFHSGQLTELQKKIENIREDAHSIRTDKDRVEREKQKLNMLISEKVRLSFHVLTHTGFKSCIDSCLSNFQLKGSLLCLKTTLHNF